MKLSAIVVIILNFVVEQSYCTEEYACENDWDLFESSCYKAGIATEVYPVAEIKCLNMGGHLATIHTEEENQFVTSTRVALASSHLQWIGLKKIQSKWTWTDGSSSNFRYWAPSQPARDNCVATNKFDQYKWHDINCYREADYVCEKEATLVVVEPTTDYASTAATMTDATALPTVPTDSATVESTTDSASTAATMTDVTALPTVPTDSATVEFTTDSPSTAATMTDATALPTVPTDSSTVESTTDSASTAVTMTDVTALPTEENACSDGWKYLSETNSCYKAGDTAKTFENAERDCVSMGAHLTSVLQHEENEFVTGSAVSASTEQLRWIGLTRSTSVSEWTWTDNSPVTSFMWGTSQPTTDRCTATNSKDSFMWHDINCGRQLDYVCKKGSVPVEVPTDSSTVESTTDSASTSATITDATALPTVNPTCAPGWDSLSSIDSCYKVGTGKKTFDAAEQDCNGLNGHIVSINSENEYESVKGFLPTRQWIGLRKQNGVWAWTDGTDLTYTHLEQPLTYNGDCALMRPPGGGSTWTDVTCDGRIEYYICEKPTE